MNSSRLAAGAAALAVGFGVTLVGVAIADDDGNESIEFVDEGVVDELDDDQVDDDAAENDDEDDGVDERDDDDDDDTDGDADQEATEAELPEDAQVSDGDPATAPRDDDLPGGTIPADPPPETSPDNELPGPNTTELDAGAFDDVRCVDTISVVFEGGVLIDFVVLERDGEFAWLVLDVDGGFVISLDDFDVERVVEVQRDVLFFEGAPVEFYEACSETNSAPGELDERPSGRATTLDFPCSERARSAMRERLDDDEIDVLDDVGELVLAVAIELDDLGRRSAESWYDQLVVEVDSFIAFDDGCSDAVEAEFRNGDLLCAAAKITSGDRLRQQLLTAAPAAFETCLVELDTLDLDEDGDN